MIFLYKSDFWNKTSLGFLLEMVVLPVCIFFFQNKKEFVLENEFIFSTALMFSELLSVFWDTWFNFPKNLFLKENRLEEILRSWKKTSELFMIAFLLIVFVSCHSEQAKYLLYYQKTVCHKKGIREVL